MSNAFYFDHLDILPFDKIVHLFLCIKMFSDDFILTSIFEIEHKHIKYPS